MSTHVLNQTTLNFSRLLYILTSTHRILLHFKIKFKLYNLSKEK